jgi:hypothetical protein
VKILKLETAKLLGSLELLLSAFAARHFGKTRASGHIQAFGV